MEIVFTAVPRARVLASPLAAAAALIMLAACSTGPAPGPGQPATVTTPPEIVAIPKPVEPPVAAPELASRPPVNAPTPDTAPADPQRLIGVRGEALRGWLGETIFERRDGAAEIWRFAADTCYLDVFLYRENDGGLRIAHVDARPRVGTQPVTPQNCYGRIRAAHPTSKAG